MSLDNQIRKRVTWTVPSLKCPSWTTKTYQGGEHIYSNMHSGTSVLRQEYRQIIINNTPCLGKMYFNNKFRIYDFVYIYKNTPKKRCTLKTYRIRIRRSTYVQKAKVLLLNDLLNVEQYVVFSCVLPFRFLFKRFLPTLERSILFPSDRTQNTFIVSEHVLSCTFACSIHI